MYTMTRRGSSAKPTTYRTVSHPLRRLADRFVRSTDNVLHRVLGPDDWLGRHPMICLALVGMLLVSVDFLADIVEKVIAWL